MSMAAYPSSRRRPSSAGSSMSPSEVTRRPSSRSTQRGGRQRLARWPGRGPSRARPPTRWVGSRSSPPAIPTTSTWSQSESSISWRVTRAALSRPMPVIMAATPTPPTIPRYTGGSAPERRSPIRLDQRPQLGTHGGQDGDLLRMGPIGHGPVCPVARADTCGERSRAPRGQTGPMQPLAVHHVSITVTDVDTAFAFYTDVLGLVPRHDRPDFGFGGAWLDAGGQQLHLVEGRPPEDRGQHFALRVADLDETVVELRGRGAC